MFNSTWVQGALCSQTASYFSTGDYNVQILPHKFRVDEDELVIVLAKGKGSSRRIYGIIQ